MSSRAELSDEASCTFPADSSVLSRLNPFRYHSKQYFVRSMAEDVASFIFKTCFSGTLTSR